MPASPLLTVMIKAARKAAPAIRRDFGEVELLQVSQKGPADFVTRSDRKAEATVRAELEKARPGYGFLMEEGGVVEGSDPQHRWIIDPIDGTTNFIHGIPHLAVSIALERQGELVAGVVYNPITDDLYVGERGRGAFLNDRRLRVSARRDLRECVIGCGLPHRSREDHERFRRELGSVQELAAGVRRFGAASLDLAWVAAGRLDGFWERGLAPWDIAAGLVLLREAGGLAGDLDGAPDVMKTGNIVAAGAELYPHLQKVLAGG